MTEDWRVETGERQLGRDKTLHFRRYFQWSDSWDHDHCEGCFARFSLIEPGALTEGYVTEDEEYWVCSKCFEEIGPELGWKLGKSEKKS